MRRPALALIAVLAATPAFAQSNIGNADLQARPAGDLAQTFTSLATDAGPLWIGYSVPAHDPDWNSCCYSNGDHCCGRCALERTESDMSFSGRSSARGGPVQLEGAANLVVLFRIVNRGVEKIRTFSESCEIDAGGRRVYWLTGVDPAASVRLLSTYARTPAKSGEKKSKVADGAVMALSAHREPAALDTLIQIARTGEQAHTRGQALFWLAHRAGEKAAGTITDAIENDPDTEVKTRAVFALSQLPKDEGVPKLIEVARTNRNRKVRQQAMFWLGQSRDPRALKFFEEVLLKN
jgi:HEAT repeats